MNKQRLKEAADAGKRLVQVVPRMRMQGMGDVQAKVDECCQFACDAYDVMVQVRQNFLDGTDDQGEQAVQLIDALIPREEDYQEEKPKEEKPKEDYQEEKPTEEKPPIAKPAVRQGDNKPPKK